MFLHKLINSEGALLSLAIETACVIIKILIFAVLVNRKKALTYKKNDSFFYLSLIFLTGIFTNISLIAFHLGCKPFEIINPLIFKFFMRIDSASLALQIYSIFLFSKGLTSGLEQKLNRLFFLFFKCFTCVSIIIFSLWSIKCGIVQNFKVTERELFWYRVWEIILYSEILTALFLLYSNYKNESLRLLRYHLHTLGCFYFFPYFLLKISESDFLAPIYNFPSFIARINIPAATFSSLWLTALTYYCARRLMGMRFLNMHTHVRAKRWGKLNFVDDYKTILEKLEGISDSETIEPLVQDFFHKSFATPLHSTKLILRNKHRRLTFENADEHFEMSLFIDRAFYSQSKYPNLQSFLKREKILIRDEIEFTHFYNTQEATEENLEGVIAFLKDSKGEVFIPLYHDNHFMGSLIIMQESRKNGFYTDIDRDQMIVFSNTLAQTIYVTVQEKEQIQRAKEHALALEVYKQTRIRKRLELCVLKTISSEQARSQQPGIILYRNKKFIYSNQAAYDLLGFDLNTTPDFSPTKILREMAYEAAVFFKSHKKIISLSPGGNEISVKVEPHFERNGVVITLQPPSVNDYLEPVRSLFKKKKDVHLTLALRATGAGKRINTFLPANTPQLLTAKVRLLEYALEKKTLFIESSSIDDVIAYVHVLNKINKRTELEICDVERFKNSEQATQKLFGINKSLENASIGLLESLHKKGTLLLSSIETLSFEVQYKVASFITTGMLCPLFDDQSFASNILLVITSRKKLVDLLDEGRIIPDLFEILKRSKIIIPTIASLPAEEFYALLEGLREQLIRNRSYQNLLTFSDYDAKKLYEAKAQSLARLKAKMRYVLLEKTRKHDIKGENIIDPAATISDLDLARATRMGKAVLKDAEMLEMLLKKFNYSQAAVAAFIGVNRSSINRRCLHHHLLSKKNKKA